MSTALSELDSLITLLETQIPANPKSLKNQKLRKRLEEFLAKYFNKLERAFPYSQIEKMYNKYVIKEQLGGESEGMIDALLATFDKQLGGDIGGELAGTYISGQAEMISYGKTKLGVPIAYEGPPIGDAIKWAEKHGAELVTQMDEETKRRLANVIGNGIKNKRGIPGLSRDIKKSFTDMSRFRSQMIARTETANALSQASLDNMKDMGIEGKEWVTGGDPCEICEGNENAGVISVKDTFPSGHERPPAHPNCECAIAPARLPEKAEPTKAKPGKLSGEKWIKSLPKEERNALKSWQGSSGQVRAVQKTGKGTQQFKTMTRNLENALDKAQPYKGKAYRGISDLDSRTYNLLKSQDTFKWDALSSASADERLALGFARCSPSRSGILFKIANKTGVDISKVQQAFAYEKEVILRKDTVYKVISRVETTPFRGGQKVLEITLSEV